MLTDLVSGPEVRISWQVGTAIVEHNEPVLNDVSKIISILEMFRLCKATAQALEPQFL